jgi:hypothetical protein
MFLILRCLCFCCRIKLRDMIYGQYLAELRGLTQPQPAQEPRHTAWEIRAPPGQPLDDKTIAQQ